jgi:hypothetical protein
MTMIVLAVFANARLCAALVSVMALAGIWAGAKSDEASWEAVYSGEAQDERREL